MILKQIQSFKSNNYNGICHAIGMQVDGGIVFGRYEAVREFIEEHFPEYYSGDSLYPIIHPEYDCPQVGYEYSFESGALDYDPLKHMAYKSRRQEIFDKMVELSHLFTFEPTATWAHDETFEHDCYVLIYVGEQNDI